MVIYYIVALTHELIPFLAAVIIWPSLHFGLRAVKLGGESRPQGFTLITLGICTIGLGLWYINTVSRDGNALSQWLGVIVPDGVADNAENVGQWAPGLSLTALNTMLAVSAWHQGHRNTAILAGIVGLLSALIVLNSIYNELFL